MATKGINLIIKLKGQVDKMLPGHLKKIATQAKELRVKQEQLNKAMRAGKEQQQLKKEMRETNKIYIQTRRELKLLENAKRTGKALTDQEKQKYHALNQKAKELEKTIKSQSKSYQKYGMELKKLKIPFDQLQSELDQTNKKYKEMMATQRIATGVENFKKGLSNFKEKAKAIAKTALAIGTAVAIGIGVNSAQEYIQFDKQIRKVQALTGATAEEFQTLKEKAMEVGKSTIFTSDEAAAGMEKFALAGFKPKEIIAALPGVFDLAAASGEDFVMIADMISDHMQAFNLSVNEIGGAADILANTMARSNTNVQGLSEAFKYASAGAHDLHMDLATTAAAVGLMGDQAIKSGQAGRNLKAAFGKIADSDVQKKLKKLGVQVKGANGEFIGMVSFVKQLEKVTKNMSGIDKLGLLKDLFGDHGALAMNKLLTATKEVNGVMYKGADALAQFAKENTNAQGKAKEMSNILLEGPSGKWELLKSAISDVKLKIGEIIFKKGGLDILGLATQYANELSNVLSGITNNSKANIFWQDFIKHSKKALTAAKEVGIIIWNIFKILNTIGIDNILVFSIVFSMTSKAIKFGKAISGVFSTIKAAGGIISALKTGIAALGGPISLFIAALVMVGYIIYKNWDTIKGWLIAIKDGISNFIAGAKEKIASGTTWLTEKIISIFLWLVEKAKWVGWNVLIYFVPFGPIIRHWGFIKEKALSIFEKLKDVMFSLKETIKNFFIELFNFIPELIRKAKEKTIDFLKSIPGVNLLFSEAKERKRIVNGSHANGLSYVPFDGYIAELHKGERVLTEEENSSIFGKLRDRVFLTKNSYNKNTNGVGKAPIIINWESHFNGVSESTKNSIVEELQRQLKQLEEKIIKIAEGDETRARLSL